jgi:hypothetical protein
MIIHGPAETMEVLQEFQVPGRYLPLTKALTYSMTHHPKSIADVINVLSMVM